MTTLAAPNPILVYVGRIRQFDRHDWAVYVAWVGLMFGLVGATGGFLIAGHLAGVRFPGYAWSVPVGAAIFSGSIAFDTIGHRTIYKEEIQKAEGLVHGVTIFCGITSTVLLALAYRLGDAVWAPAMALTVMSFVYSLVDEFFHWRRYVQHHSDPVEMWSHVGIFVGHLTMMIAWWQWYFAGYPGVSETLRALGAG